MESGSAIIWIISRSSLNPQVHPMGWHDSGRDTAAISAGEFKQEDRTWY
jgi:hypothetical protein